MFDDLDDDNDLHVPDDALARARAVGATRVRRRYAVVGGVAMALLIAATIPLLSQDGPKTNVRTADEPTTQSVDTTRTTDTTLATDQTTANSTTDAPRPKDGGAIVETMPVFARVVDGALVVSHYDGTDRRVVATEVSTFSVSPRHTRVLVATANQVLVYDGRSGRVLTAATLASSETASWAPRPWSPDAAKVTFSVAGAARLYDVAAETSRNIESEGTWSPDSQSIAYVSGQGGSSELRVFRAEGGAAKSVAHDVGAWMWSPDSRSIAYGGFYGTAFGQPQEPDADRPLHVVRSDGSDNRTFATAKGGAKIVVQDLSWSPDGRSLLTYKRIFRHDTTTTCPCAVGGDPSVEVLDVATAKWRTFEGTQIAWNNTSTGAILTDRRLPSPQVAVQNPWTTDSTAVFLDDGSGFYTQPIDGSAGRRIPSMSGAWLPSPTRATVAYGTDNERRVVDVATLDDRPVAVAWEFVTGWFDWSPDGSVFVVRDSNTKDYVVIGRDGAIKWRFHD